MSAVGWRPTAEAYLSRVTARTDASTSGGTASLDNLGFPTNTKTP